VLPACVGFAVVSPHVANVVLGPDFRAMAVVVMPIVSIALIFQVMAYQYLHVSFLLSERNSFFLLNTGSALAVNVIVSFLLIYRFGAVGAAWGRLAAEIFGFGGALLLTQWAFPMPVPYARLTRVVIATIVMAIAVRGLERVLPLTDRDALVVLLPAGIVTYLAMCLMLNVAKSRSRLRHGLLVLRNAIAR
jgi:O-antigen/teichoic acid export membrane protein